MNSMASMIQKLNNLPRPKNCYCYTCEKEYHHMGIARHRAMHRDKKENYRISFSNGDTYLFKYSEGENKGSDL